MCENAKSIFVRVIFLSVVYKSAFPYSSFLIDCQLRSGYWQSIAEHISLTSDSFEIKISTTCRRRRFVSATKNITHRYAAAVAVTTLWIVQGTCSGTQNLINARAIYSISMCRESSEIFKLIHSLPNVSACSCLSCSTSGDLLFKRWTIYSVETLIT